MQQLTLLLASGVEAVEHVIDTGGQPPELVVAGREVDAVARLAAVDPVDDVGDLLDRLQHPPRDHPREQCGGNEGHRHRGQHPPNAITTCSVRCRGRVLGGDLHQRDPIADLLDAGDRDRLGVVPDPSPEQEAEQPDECGRRERESSHAEREPPAQRAPAARVHAADRSR